MLAIPALVPAALAAYSVVGERAAGDTRAGPDDADPPRGVAARQGAGGARPGARDLVRGIRAVVASIAAVRGRAGRVGGAPGPELVAQVLFTPLLATWSIWVGIAISARSNDTRVAQQLSILASLPPVVITSLIAFGVIHATFGLAVALAAVLLALDRLGWRFVSALFDRERLITGTRS